ncbi:MAG: hypothetical protein LBM09_01030 [Candidatus Nomurabacteria bacterium]|jgi:lactate dehydrogenase-like 2-hydroxyacid dehydrogenase|nr:hypothetical protein [Candidatus Nomurabacteria bacterium]
MNLYIYCQKNSSPTPTQTELLTTKFDNVFQIHEADFTDIKNDQSEKIVALDPDVIDWKFPNDLIDDIPNLHAICLQTTGYEWIDSNYCRNKNIAVANVPKYATNAVAEKALFMALALAKKFPLFAREGKMNWDTEFIGGDIRDKPTDIIGFGAIGQRLAEILTPLVGEKEICYYSRHKQDTKYHYTDFNDMLAKSEYMFVTVAKNNESLALFDDLSKFNKNMKVVIIANGFEKVAERMAKMVECGDLGGVAFESNDLSHEYHDNVFVTPPNAYYTADSLVNMFEIWVDTMISAIDKPKNLVN